MRLRKNPFLYFVLAVSLYLIACSKPEAEPNPPTPPTPSLVVDNATLNFKSGSTTDSITITSTDPWTVSIPTTATWVSADKTSGVAGTSKIKITVTPNTSDISRTCALSINRTGSTLIPVMVNLTQDQPEVDISSFTPHAPGGDVITLNGTGFSPTVGNNIVKINGIVATVNTATTTTLSVKVPLRAGIGRIQVSVNAKSDTSSTDFIYDWIGTVSIIAGGEKGFADGVGANAKFSQPAGIDIDASGNLYVADWANYKVRKVTPDGTVTTFPGRIPSWADPSGPNTDFDIPGDVAIDASGNLFVAEERGNAISKIAPNGTVTLVAGGGASGTADGTGTGAQFYWPMSIEVDETGNLIVADAQNNRIRKVISSGVVTTLAGSVPAYLDGPGTTAKFNMPTSVIKDLQGNFLITDYFNYRVRKMTPDGVVTTFAGNGQQGATDGDLLTANIYWPTDITINSKGNIYLCDGNSKIRFISSNGKVNTINTNITFDGPKGIAVDNNDNVYISDMFNHRICKVTYQ